MHESWMMGFSDILLKKNIEIFPQFFFYILVSKNWLPPPHSSWQWLLGPKKSSSKSTNIGPKAHIVATWETIKKLKNNTPLGDSSYHALPNLPKWLDILA